MKRARSLTELTQIQNSERAALGDYLGRLRARFDEQVLRVIFFGSRARGEGNDDADLDVLVIVDGGDWRLKDAIADESVEPWLMHNALISPITMDQKAFLQLQEWGTLFYRNLERDGIDLWITEPVLS